MFRNHFWTFLKKKGRVPTKVVSLRRRGVAGPPSPPPLWEQELFSPRKIRNQFFSQILWFLNIFQSSTKVPPRVCPFQCLKHFGWAKLLCVKVSMGAASEKCTIRETVICETVICDGEAIAGLKPESWPARKEPRNRNWEFLTSATVLDFVWPTSTQTETITHCSSQAWKKEGIWVKVAEHFGKTFW